jgi:mono/diheme cytochrome c family protein
MTTPPNQSQTMTSATFVSFAVIMIVFVLILISNLSTRTIVEVAVAPTETLPPPTATPQVGYFSQDVSQGRALFMGTCAGCHGMDARGITGIGPSLVNTSFVNDRTDTRLREFIIEGRDPFHPDNSTGIAMPARGGNPSLTDGAIDQIIAFLRVEADPFMLIAAEDMPVQPTNTPRPPSADFVANPTVVPYVELPTLEPRPFDVERGYALSCSGCHGANGEGVEGITSAFVDSDLLLPENAEDLFNFIVEGNLYVNLLEEIPHPARGDYPTMTDEQIREVIDHLYTLIEGQE